MRALLWLLVLFVLATLLALLAGNNQAVLTLYWSPTRAIDISLNMAILLLLGLFLLGHAVMRGISSLIQLPKDARRWRIQQKERALHGHLLDAMSHYLAGRFSRARQAGERALRQEESLNGQQADPRDNVPAAQRLPYSTQLRALTHFIMAESSQAMQDGAQRDQHYAQALQAAQDTRTDIGVETREGIQLRATRWAIEDRQPAVALERLDALPQGTGRRVLALRHRLKAARQLGNTDLALDTARTLARHKAFTPEAGRVLVGRLIVDQLRSAFDLDQLQRIWMRLDREERAWPEVALAAARQLVSNGGTAAQARAWLLPVWERVAAGEETLTSTQRSAIVAALEPGLEDIDGDWLQRIEAAYQRYPNRADMQYLMGMACMKRQLWGKAQQFLSQATHGLQDEPELRRNAWRALAELAEERSDAAAAQEAWKQAALVR
ncbi:MAG: heme biosynthesis HemY N-terminal domain-containing protein [Brachymonas denitrificans]|uniref:heme biosynthesis HemY N-terminal domain-containing protein n=1 Tax=Brachymonas denitrificans TaxID=28220 RepID=UPI00352BD371